MPTNDEFQVYREALAAELQPAMGCTEPIALAYAAAKVGKRLGGYPEAIDVEFSRSPRWAFRNQISPPLPPRRA